MFNTIMGTILLAFALGLVFNLPPTLSGVLGWLVIAVMAGLAGIGLVVLGFLQWQEEMELFK